MSKFLWWVSGIIFVVVLVAGVPAAFSITHTLFSTTGKTSGLIAGGVPELVGGFRQGFSAGGHGNGHGNSGTSWAGPNTSWSGLTATPHKPKHHAAPAKRHHVKPNV